MDGPMDQSDADDVDGESEPFLNEHMTAAALNNFLRLLASEERFDSHDALCHKLEQDRYLKGERMVKAFRAVDRGHFLCEECLEEAYFNSPVRHQNFHHSAPSIYASALEALDLSRPQLSFLNIGSGTGYFSALVAQFIGPDAVHIGVERHLDVVLHARERCTEAGFKNIRFVQGNCYDIDVKNSMKFDRIYVGAGVPKDAQFLLRLLKKDGIVVAPFEDDADPDGQRMLKVTQLGSGVTKAAPCPELTSVRFAWLARPRSESSTTIEEDDEQAPHPKIVIQGPLWGDAPASMFPSSFRRTFDILRWMVDHVNGSLPGRLPWDFWLRHILPFLSFDDFEGLPPPRWPTAPAAQQQQRQPLAGHCAACGSAGAGSMCGRCKRVRYCDRACQRRHWSAHKAVCGREVVQAVQR